MHDEASPGPLAFQLKQLVEQLIDARSLASRSEKEDEALADRIGELSPDPDWSDYVFWSQDFNGPDGKLDVGKVVARIMVPPQIIYAGPPDE